MTAKQLKNSILKEAFEGKLTIPSLKNSVKAKNKIDFHSAHGNDNLPQDWKELPFLKCVNVIGVKHKIKRKSYLKNGKYPIIDQSYNFISGFSSNENFLIKIKKPVIIFGDHTRCFKFVDFDFIAGADGIKILEPKEFFNEKLFYYFCLSLNIPSRGYSRHYKFLTKTIMKIPPIEEQKRIVNKLNELMPLIEEYEKLENKLNELDKKFPERLKKSILKEAVCGRLVSQNKEDEPASELLKRIKAEREKLIKEKKIKADKTTSIIYRKGNSYCEERDGREICIDDEIPFEIPNSWEWVYFKDIVYYSMGKTPPRKEKEYWCNPQFAWVSIADLVANGFISETKEKVNQYSVDKIFRNKISVAGTLLMSFKLTVGKVSILEIDAYHNEAIISIYPFVNDKNITRDYLFYILPLISQYGNTKSAIKGNTLNSDSLDLLYIPLPPLEEQKRIVKKLKKLVNLCEKMTK